MKKVSLLLILFFLIIGKGFTQIPVLTPSGQIMSDYYPFISTNKILVNDDNTLLTHHIADGYTGFFKRIQLERLLSYNKDNRSIKIEELTVPNQKETSYLFSKNLGDDVIIYYYEEPKKSNQFIVKSTTISQNISNTKKNLNLGKLFSLNIGDKEYVSHIVTESPDKSKYAFCFIVTDRKNTMRKFMIMVFDEKGEVIWKEDYNPDFSEKEVVMYDSKLSNDGKMLLLVSSSSGKRKGIPVVQLMSFYENEHTATDVEVPNHNIQSMRMLILSNDTYFVGGYYAEKKGTTDGYFTMIFDPRSETLLKKEFSKFNDNYFEKGFLGWGKLAFTNQTYNVKCDHLFELDNGSVAMLGEQHHLVVTVNNKGQYTYKYFRKHIICNMFSLDGDKNGYEMIKRSQALVSGVPVNNVANYGLSYSPIIKGSDIYLLYNDNIHNYNGKAKNWETINISRPKIACTILAKINMERKGKTERKVVMLPNKDGRILHKLWAFDGQTAVFGIMSKKLYSIEQFEVNDQWSWD